VSGLLQAVLDSSVGEILLFAGVPQESVFSKAGILAGRSQLGDRGEIASEGKGNVQELRGMQ
jgi:hypothetical protein